MSDTRVNRTRTQLAVDWIVWHFAELAGVLAPLVLAAVFTGWLALLSPVAAGVWGVREIREARAQRPIRQRLEARAAISASGENAATDHADNEDEAAAGDVVELPTRGESA